MNKFINFLFNFYFYIFWCLTLLIAFIICITPFVLSILLPISLIYLFNLNVWFYLILLVLPAIGLFVSNINYHFLINDGWEYFEKHISKIVDIIETKFNVKLKC